MPTRRLKVANDPSHRCRLKSAGGWVCLYALVALLMLSGCQVEVLGQKRPLVRRGPIHGSVEIEADHKIDKNTSSGNTTKNTTTEMLELLRLETSGDVFHPNLLLFDAMVAFGLRQSSYDFDGDTDKGTGDLQEYSFQGQLFQTKSYPISFFLDRSDNLIPRLFSSSLISIQEAQGVTLNLQADNWPMTFSYSERNTDQKGQSREDQDRYILDDDRFRYTLSHNFTELSRLQFEFDHREVSQERFNNFLDWTEERYNLRHRHFFDEQRRYELSSYLYFLDQTGDFELDQTIWTELLSLRHTDDFNTFYSFVYSESEQSSSKNDQARLEGGFNHQLYDSLDTTGRLYVSEENSDDIQVDRTGGSLSFRYRKNNPWGQLNSSYSVSFDDLDQTGGGSLVSVIDERHPFTITGTLRIELDQLNIDPATIIVWDTTRTKFYLDYNVIQTNGITEIQVIPGGDIFNDGDQVLSFDYDFQTEPERQQDSVNQLFTIRQNFMNGIGVYYRHARRRESIDSTEPVFPDEYSTNTYGTDYTNRGLLLLAEYTDDNSTRDPYTRTSLSGSNLWVLDRDTSLSFFATADWSDYETEDPYDITFYTAGGEWLSRLTSRYTLSSRLFYRDENDSRVGATQGYDWNAELSYRFRQLSYVTGVELSFLDFQDTETDNARWYFRLKREF